MESTVKHEMKEDAGHRSLSKGQNPYLLGIVLLCAGIASALVQYKVPTILTDLMARFSMDASVGSWLMSIFTLMYVFVAIPTGRLAQRFGAKKMVLAGLVLAIIGSVIGLLSNMNATLLLSRAVEGAAQCVIVTAGPILIQRAVASNKISTTMSIWGLWGCLGSTGGSILTPTIFQSMGYNSLWTIYAVIAAVIAVVVMILVKEPTELEFGAYEEEKDYQPPRYREMFTKDIFLFFVAFMIFNLILLAILAFVPTILQAQGYNAQLSGFISTLSQLLSIFSAPVFGIIADRTGRIKPFMVLSMLVMGPCCFIMYNTTGAPLWIADLIIGLVAMGAVGLFLSSFTKLLPRPELGSISMGVMMCVQGIGSFFGTYIIQMLLGPNLDQVLFAGIVIMVLGLIATGCLAMIKLK